LFAVALCLLFLWAMLPKINQLYCIELKLGIIFRHVSKRYEKKT